MLDNTKSPTWRPRTKTQVRFPGPWGLYSRALVDFASPGGQVGNVTDVDSGALLGIAVTAADTTNGSWY